MTARRIIVIGLPKCGTTTLHNALTMSGIESAHYKWGSRFVGEIIYANMKLHRDPMTGLPQAVTQIDVCSFQPKANYWPQCDWHVLNAMRTLYRDAVFILNTRPVHAHAQSIMRWKDYQQRLVHSPIPGLPIDFGKTASQLEEWIANHNARMRNLFEYDTRFVEIDITREQAPTLLSKAIGKPVGWWGVANASEG